MFAVAPVESWIAVAIRGKKQLIFIWELFSNFGSRQCHRHDTGEAILEMFILHAKEVDKIGRWLSQKSTSLQYHQDPSWIPQNSTYKMIEYDGACLYFQCEEDWPATLVT